MKNSPAVGWYCIEFVVVRLEAASDVSWPSWLWLLLDSSSIFIDGHSDDKSFKIFLWKIKITANNFLYHTAAFILSPFFVFYSFKYFSKFSNLLTWMQAFYYDCWDLKTNQYSPKPANKTLTTRSLQYAQYFKDKYHIKRFP